MIAIRGLLLARFEPCTFAFPSIVFLADRDPRSQVDTHALSNRRSFSFPSDVQSPLGCETVHHAIRSPAQPEVPETLWASCVDSLYLCFYETAA